MNPANCNKAVKVCHDIFDVKLIIGQTYACRFGRPLPPSAIKDKEPRKGLCSIILCNEAMPPWMELAFQYWTAFYLRENISHLKLKPEEIEESRMVVAVDTTHSRVRRGLVRRDKCDRGSVMVYFFDEGMLEAISKENLYQTTELVATTSPMGFQCYLADLSIFNGTTVLKDTMKLYNNMFHPGLRRDSNVMVKVEGFKRDSYKTPIVSIWLQDCDQPCTKANPFNRLVASHCLESWTEDIKREKPVNSAYQGYVAHCNELGRLFVHIAFGDESPVVQMDQYLLSFDIQYLEDTCKRYTKEELLEQPQATKPIMFVAYSYKDGGVYRCKIQEVLEPGAIVYFLDYGNTGFVLYDHLFAAKEVDPFLERIPPLAWEVHLCSVDKLKESSGNITIMDYFEKLENDQYKLNFTVRDGYSGNIPLVSIAARRNGGVPIDVVKELIDRGVAIRRRKRTPSGPRLW